MERIDVRGGRLRRAAIVGNEICTGITAGTEVQVALCIDDAPATSPVQSLAAHTQYVPILCCRLVDQWQPDTGKSGALSLSIRRDSSGRPKASVYYMARKRRGLLRDEGAMSILSVIMVDGVVGSLVWHSDESAATMGVAMAKCKGASLAREMGTRRASISRRAAASGLRAPCLLRAPRRPLLTPVMSTLTLCRS